MAQPNIVKDFVTPQTAKYLNDYLRERVEVNPMGLLNVYLQPLNITRYGGEQSYIIQDLINNIERSIAYSLGFPKDKVRLYRMNYQVLESGQGLGWHSDSKGGVSGYTDNCYSALLYLTDDYTGGEILFYEENSMDKTTATKYHPSAGTLIYFRGDEKYPHSVEDVITGERANLILFYDVDES
jgi:hypothetical protein